MKKFKEPDIDPFQNGVNGVYFLGNKLDLDTTSLLCISREIKLNSGNIDRAFRFRLSNLLKNDSFLLQLTIAYIKFEELGAEGLFCNCSKPFHKQAIVDLINSEIDTLKILKPYVEQYIHNQSHGL